MLSRLEERQILRHSHGGYEAEGLYDPSQLPGHGTFSLRRFYTERAHREDPA